MKQVQKDPSLWLYNMLAASISISDHTHRINKNDFLKSALVQDAVIRQLEIIGEAAKRINKDLRNEEKGIPWREISGMRDKLAHDYMEVDLEAVWKTVQDDIPSLAILLKKLIKKIGR